METILIIGATSGIAQAIARKFAGGGASLILWGRSPEKLKIVADDLQTQYGAPVQTEAFDFNDLSKHAAAVAAATANGLDGVLICHGTLGDQAACERDFAAAEMELRSNLLSTLSFLTVFANYFEKGGKGWIAAISSVAGDRGRKSNYVYGTAKAALSTFLQGLRNRLYHKGVAVITIKPGFVDTPMTAGMRKGPLFAMPEAVAADIVKAIRKGTPILYTPWFWRWIMLIIKAIPERIFRALNL